MAWGNARSGGPLASLSLSEQGTQPGLSMGEWTYSWPGTCRSLLPAGGPAPPPETPGRITVPDVVLTSAHQEQECSLDR